ncbi:PDDEXK family nuclease [Thiomicrospira microaerophila]|uniref:Card1-like endonuclease domain-containing protein n=1 Tax=Thiomicrospira microaerophila TaxID=406020 RepID=UPI0005C96FBE|nr:DUF1887 family CARF protein [Thiomicrospira microaerophila]
MSIIKPINYVVIASGHNLPSLVPLLDYRPQRVTLIVSDFIKQQTRERIEALIAKHLPQTQWVMLDLKKRSGDAISDITDWINQDFVPEYQSNATTYDWILNVTGGTKLLALLLETAVDWQEVHYKSLTSPLVQRWTYHNKQRQILSEKVINHIDTLDALSLYTDYTLTENNRIEDSPNAINIAEKIWQHYEQPADNIHQALSVVLQKEWSNSAHKTKELRLEIDLFKNYPEEEVLNWFSQLADLIPDSDICRLENKTLILPGNKLGSSKHDKLRKDWKKWISGIWLETLIHYWFEQQGIQVARNVKIKDQNRELDFVLLYQHNLHVIEVKNAPPHNKDMSDIIRQIKSVTEIGMLKNYLFISPYFEKVNQDNLQKIDDFKMNCKLNQIALIASKQQLIQKFQKN